jgi:hypothetical protein
MGASRLVTIRLWSRAGPREPQLQSAAIAFSYGELERRHEARLAAAWECGAALPTLNLHHSDDVVIRTTRLGPRFADHRNHPAAAEAVARGRRHNRPSLLRVHRGTECSDGGLLREHIDAERNVDARPWYSSDLIIRGTPKILDPTVANTGMLLASQTGDSVFRRYHNMLCERFWRGGFDIEDPAAVRAVLVEADWEGHAFDKVITSGEGARQCRVIVADAEEQGVFGVPTFVLDEAGELFWGTDRVGCCVSPCRKSCNSRNDLENTATSAADTNEHSERCSLWLPLDFV